MSDNTNMIMLLFSYFFYIHKYINMYIYKESQALTALFFFLFDWLYIHKYKRQILINSYIYS